MDSNANNTALLLGRVLASIAFVLGGWGKLMAAAATKTMLANRGLPMPEIAYLVTVAVELGGGLLFVLGAWTRPVALVLAVWCIATALIAHTDFAVMGQLISFTKNTGMAGGFLAFMVVGAGAFSVDAALHRGRRAIA